MASRTSFREFSDLINETNKVKITLLIKTVKVSNPSMFALRGANIINIKENKKNNSNRLTLVFKKSIGIKPDK